MFGALAVFCVSGCAALLYQVVWQRMLVIFAGTDVHSAAIVVAAFMAGLGCGSLAGGRLADRIGARASLALFAAAECAIALFGLTSRRLFYDFLYTTWGHLDIGLAPTAMILFAALLWPTFFMGASLPLLTRGLTRSIHRAAMTTGWLYAFNTFGAAAGALGGGWLLLPQLGLEGTLRVAAALNLACAAAVALLAVSRGRHTPPAARDHEANAVVRDGNPVAAARLVRVSRWAIAYALAGFLGLSLEIVWFRVLGVMLKSTSFTFATLLGVYLFGLALGGAIGSALAPMVRRPGLWFAIVQAAAGTYAALSLTLFTAGLEPSSAFEWFGRYFGQYDGVDIRAALAGWVSLVPPAGSVTRDFLRLYLVLPAVLIGPPTIMAGLSFPLLQRVIQNDLAFLGRRTGLLLAANIFGGTLGALVTGWWLLGVAGTAGTLKVLFVGSALFALLAIAELPLRRSVGVGLAAGVAALPLAAVFAAMPDGELLWARLHGTTPNRIIHGEDGSGLALLKSDPGVAGRTVVFTNGLGQSWIPYGDIHTVLGALPAFAHPHPRSAALIGFGSGDTLYALAGRQEIRRITSIEIVAPQLDTLRRFARKRQNYPPILSLEGDARIAHVFGDGRSYLKRSMERYDIIEADALRPESAFAGNLYSDAYFSLIRDRLNPGGLAVTWAPTDRVVQTFVKVFPYAWQHGQVLMGSNAPIVVDRPAIIDRLTTLEVVNHFSWAGVEIYPLLRPYTLGAWREYIPSYDRSAIDDINTDLFPRDEFEIPALFNLRGRARP